MQQHNVEIHQTGITRGNILQNSITLGCNLRNFSKHPVEIHQTAITRGKIQQNAITHGWNPRNCSKTRLKFTKLPLHEVKSNKLP
jgi:hypothetical protein